MPYTSSLSTSFGSPPLADLRPCKEPSTSFSSLRNLSGILPDSRDDGSTSAIAVKAFVSPRGQYYVVTELSGVRIDCHNAATARYYVKNGVSAALRLSCSD